jgi:hypothetical protein
VRIKIVRINLCSQKEESEVVSLVETMVSKTNIRLLWTSLNKQKGADHEAYCYDEDEEGWETRWHGAIIERLRYDARHRKRKYQFSTISPPNVTNVHKISTVSRIFSLVIPLDKVRDVIMCQP